PREQAPRRPPIASPDRPLRLADTRASEGSSMGDVASYTTTPPECRTSRGILATTCFRAPLSRNGFLRGRADYRSHRLPDGGSRTGAEGVSYRFIHFRPLPAHDRRTC